MSKHTRRPKSEYIALLNRRRDEGLTFAELSEASGVPACTLQYWARKLRQVELPQSATESSDAFVQVSLTETAPSTIEVVVHDGVRIAVRPGFDPMTLRALVDALAC